MKVTLADVLRWVAAALDAARKDREDEGDTVNALSGRRLWVSMRASPGSLVVEVTTLNFAFSGSGSYVYDRTTADGVLVVWNERDVGVPNGADWLPSEFISWMMEGETG